MKKKIISALLIICMLIAPAAMAQDNASQQSAAITYTPYMQKQIIKTYAKVLSANYYYGVEDEELLYSVICNIIDEGKLDIDSAVEAMLGTLGDEYAEFYSPEEYAAMTEDVAGEFSGIGVIISENKDGVVALSVIENSPAYKAGMMPYDYIIGVDGVDMRGKSGAEIRTKIVGEKGTQVTVRVLRSGNEIDLVCTRDTVEVSQIETKMLTDKIAYIKLQQFTTNAPKEMAAHVEKLKENRVKNLVLDLRNNPGGDLESAVGIANIFVSAGDIGELRYKNAPTEVIKSTNYNAPRFNMIVLINEHSASASEFLTMALQSRGTAKVLGVQSYGKGSMQAASRIVTGAGFKYTIGEFYSFKGDRINTIGITPDYVVENEIVKVDTTQFAPINIDVIAENPRDEENVLALEQRLKVLGYMDAADGVYDDVTKDAVARFQATLGYSITGEAGIYEYVFLNDYNFDELKTIKDNQLDAAIKYLR